MVSVTIWNEYRHEREDNAIAAVYPDGIHASIAEAFGTEYDVNTATLEEPEHGLSESILDETDVLTWWGHLAHDEVDDAVVARVCERVLDGMGLLVLHSGHYSKVFTRLMGTSCSLGWREDEGTERLWVVDPGHPIADGLDASFELPKTEMYSEPFDIPEPDRLVFLSWFEGGEVFRSGCCFRRGRGRIFYFRPGHETAPIYDDETVRHVLRNAVDWAARGGRVPRPFGERE